MAKHSTEVGKFTTPVGQMVVYTCGECGHAFAFTIGLEYALRESHDNHYCVACGCKWHFGSETTEEKLRRELKAANDSRDYHRTNAEHQERRARAYKGKATAIRRRVGRGVCPCCNRSFVNVQRHMECKHPDYAEKAEA